MVHALNVNFGTVFREGGPLTNCTRKLLGLVHKIRDVFLKILQTLLPCFFRAPLQIKPERVNQELNQERDNQLALPQQNPPLNEGNRQAAQQLHPVQPNLNVENIQEQQQPRQVLNDFQPEPEDEYELENENPLILKGSFGQIIDDRDKTPSDRSPFRNGGLDPNVAGEVSEFLNSEDVDRYEEEQKEDPSFEQVMQKIRHQQNNSPKTYLSLQPDSMGKDMVLKPIKPSLIVSGNKKFENESLAAFYVCIMGVKNLPSFIKEGKILPKQLDDIFNEAIETFKSNAINFPASDMHIEDLLDDFDLVSRDLSVHKSFQKPSDPCFRYLGDQKPNASNHAQNDDQYQESIENIALALKLSASKDELLGGFLFRGSVRNPKIYGIFVSYNNQRDDHDFYLLDIYGKKAKSNISLFKFESEEMLTAHFSPKNSVFGVDRNFWVMPLEAATLEQNADLDQEVDFNDEKGGADFDENDSQAVSSMPPIKEEPNFNDEDV